MKLKIQRRGIVQGVDTFQWNKKLNGQPTGEKGSMVKFELVTQDEGKVELFEVMASNDDAMKVKGLEGKDSILDLEVTARAFRGEGQLSFFFKDGKAAVAAVAKAG